MLRMLIPAAAILGLGYPLGRISGRSEGAGRVAFRRFDDGGPAGQAQPIRNAGAASMRDPDIKWSRRDDDLDQTFPASDATAKY